MVKIFIILVTASLAFVFILAKPHNRFSDCDKSMKSIELTGLVDRPSEVKCANWLEAHNMRLECDKFDCKPVKMPFQQR